MLLNILRWLQGYVCFKITGKFPERFINIVTKSGLSIWNTGRVNGDLCACMYVRDYRNIRPFSKKSRVKLKINKKVGSPFFVRKYKNRVGVLVGALVFAIVIFVMSNFVWTIEITGLQTISEAKVRQVLCDNGLYIGAYIPTKSFKIIGRDTMLELDDIGWMSINVIDSHASVEIKEKAKSPNVDNYHQPANVKAERDGLILKINVAEGEALFNSGSAVVKDQLLVSSVVEDMLGGVTLVRANAKVIAQTKRQMIFSIEKEHPRFSYEEPKSRYAFNILGLKLPLSFTFADEKENLVRYKTESVTLFDTVLPLSLNTQSIYKKAQYKSPVTEKEANDILYYYSSLYEGFELCDCIVTDRKCAFSETDTHYILDVTYTCEEDIAYQQDINIDKADTERVTPVQDKKSE
ncbi:MAG: sporulation protein YqfD [Ruminococcus sp.]|nr:sporulation protein YqfD [Ruminococcus sp.]